MSESEPSSPGAGIGGVVASKTRRSNAAVSELALIASNAAPLFGVFVLHWAVFPILLIYWCENVIVGALNVVKMALADPEEPFFWFVKVALIPFFCFHYGIFALVHGVFVFTLFGPPEFKHTQWPTLPIALHVIRDTGVGFAVLSIAASHVVSLVWNFLIKGECRRITPVELMSAPYARVVVLHIAIIGGGFLVQAMGAPQFAIVALVMAKTAIDLGAHRRERAKLSPGDQKAEMKAAFATVLQAFKAARSQTPKEPT